MSSYHTVGQGECLLTIAKQHGFTNYQEIYNHPNNASLKRKRPNPNILNTGDILFIPDKQFKQVPGATGNIHKFVVRIPTQRYRTTIRDGHGNPIAKIPYVLTLDNNTELDGETDGTGLLEQRIPLSAETAQLSLPTLNIRWTVKFGHLDPIDSVSGVQSRLKSLGYNVGAVDGISDSRLTVALSKFQKDNGLPVTGSIDSTTRAKVESLHGC